MFLRRWLSWEGIIDTEVLVERRSPGCRDFIGKWHVTRCPEATNVGTMFVFDTEEGPDPSAADLGEADEKAENGGMLKVVGEDGIKDPVETKNRVKDHGKVVDPGSFVAEHFAEEGVGGVWIAKTL